jgi:hypothetical protein
MFKARHAAVAACTGCSASRAEPPTEEYTGLTTLDRDRMICELHDQGNSRRDIERLVGVSGKVVRHVLYCGRRTETTPRIAARRLAVEQLSVGGRSAAQIAESISEEERLVRHDLHNLKAFREWRNRHPWDVHALNA